MKTQKKTEELRHKQRYEKTEWEREKQNNNKKK